jgi:uncharacterized protein (DUF885 family)
MQPKLPELFGLLPKANVEVLPVEEFREKEASGAQYNQGTPDGKRPGRVYVNTSDWTNRTLLNIETTAYHEGVPGHHMQISIAQSLPDLPPFRQQGGYNAYAEGWALYSERLGKELGFFTDPLSYYGHLSDELLRANRLVLDTGVHYKHWTRQQMVDYFHAHSSQDEPSIQSETDRYIATRVRPCRTNRQLKFSNCAIEPRRNLATSSTSACSTKCSTAAPCRSMFEARTNAWIAAQKAKQVRKLSGGAEG